MCFNANIELFFEFLKNVEKPGSPGQKYGTPPNIAILHKMLNTTYLRQT